MNVLRLDDYRQKWRKKPSENMQLILQDFRILQPTSDIINDASGDALKISISPTASFQDVGDQIAILRQCYHIDRMVVLFSSDTPIDLAKNWFFLASKAWLGDRPNRDTLLREPRVIFYESQKVLSISCNFQEEREIL